MAFSTDFVQIERISEVIGVRAALMLSGFFGKAGQRIYIPTKADHVHVISKLIGIEAFRKLVAAHPGETISIPICDLGPLRRAGQVHRLSARRVPVADIAQAVNLCPKSVQLIQGELRREGFADLAANLENGESCYG